MIVKNICMFCQILAIIITQWFPATLCTLKLEG